MPHTLPLPLPIARFGLTYDDRQTWYRLELQGLSVLISPILDKVQVDSVGELEIWTRYL